MSRISPKEIRDSRTFATIGAAMEVHQQLGCGFLEPVYQEALMIELETRSIPFVQEVELPVFYKGRKLKATYRADFICFGSVIVELKALLRVGNVEESQIINYLKATGHEVGMPLNFGAPSLQYKRYAYTQSTATQTSQGGQSTGKAQEKGR